MKDSRLDHVQSFYAALARAEERMGGRRLLRECVGRTPSPGRGVYFFFEPGEERSFSGQGPRVVRIGTHAVTAGASSTLMGRLSQHRGTSSGRGNHRGSIFRLLIGQALLVKSGRTLPSWGFGQTLRDAAARLGADLEAVRTAEAPLETEVSTYLGEMQVVWLDVPDAPSRDSLRGVIERNCIALLSCTQPLADAPSQGWLGQWSGRDDVRASGLWNNRHVRETYSPAVVESLGA